MDHHGVTIGHMARKKTTKPVDETQKPRAGYPVFARVREEVGETLERFLRSKRLPPTLGKIVEAALEDFLASEGFPVPPPKEEGGAGDLLRPIPGPDEGN